MATPCARTETISAALVFSNTLVVCVLVSLVLSLSVYLHIPTSLGLLVFLAGGVFILYQLDRACDKSPEDVFNKPERLAWNQTHPRYGFLASACAAVAMLLAVSHLSLRTLALSAVIGMVGILYCIPLGKPRWRLKHIPYAKALIVAGCWAAATVILPAVQAGAPIHSDVACLFLYRTLWLLPNLLLSNWLDREGDKRTGIRTFANEWTAQRVLSACRRVCIATLVMAGALVITIHASRWILLDAAGLLVLLAFLRRGLPESRWFYLLTVDLAACWPLVTALLAQMLEPSAP